jgi:hypothetical protein
MFDHIQHSRIHMGTVEISQTMVPLATLLVNVRRHSMNRGAPSWFPNVSTYDAKAIVHYSSTASKDL